MTFWTRRASFRFCEVWFQFQKIVLPLGSPPCSEWLSNNVAKGADLIRCSCLLEKEAHRCQ